MNKQLLEAAKREAAIEAKAAAAGDHTAEYIQVYTEALGREYRRLRAAQMQTPTEESKAFEAMFAG